MKISISRLDTASTGANNLGNQSVTAGYSRIFQEPVKDEVGSDTRIYFDPIVMDAQVNSTNGKARNAVTLPGGRELEYSIRTIVHYSQLESMGLLTPSGDCIFQPSDRLDAILNQAGVVLKDFGCSPLFLCHVRDAGWGLDGLTRNLCELYWEDRREGAPSNTRDR
jgi:hypothetical protein